MAYISIYYSGNTQLLMPHKTLILATFVAIFTVGARAQTPFSQTMNNQSTDGNTTAQTEAYSAGGMPCSIQTDYNGIGNIPLYRSESSNPSYMGVLGEKWETDKRGRRGTFIHNGQEMSVGYDIPRNEPERDTQITRPTLPSPLSDLPVILPTSLNPFLPL